MSAAGRRPSSLSGEKLSAEQRKPSAQVVLESEYHSGDECDCYLPAKECVVWAREILYALTRAGYAVTEAAGHAFLARPFYGDQCAVKGCGVPLGRHA